METPKELSVHVAFIPSLIFSRDVLEGVQEGVLPFILSQSVLEDKILLHICRDEHRLHMMYEQLSALIPQDKVFLFPQWDCLPYDRVSPKKDVVGTRLQTLFTLSHLSDERRAQGLILLTTPRAFLQKIMPKEVLTHACLRIDKNDPFEMKTFLEYVQRYNYVRVETVREPGEFAIRGGVIDLFPPQSPVPYRIDLFGDHVESIRTFDEISQRRLDDVSHMTLYPAGEVILDENSIRLFRESYRGLCKGSLDHDALYLAISEGRLFPGMDHWLPLFYPQLETVLDYMPQQVSLSFEAQGQEAMTACFQEIDDYYKARYTHKPKWGEASYYPAPRDHFFLQANDLKQIMKSYAWQTYSPYRSSSRALMFKDVLSFTTLRQQNKINLIDGVIQLIKDSVKPHLIACYSQGAMERLRTLLLEHGWPHVPVFSDVSTALDVLPRLGLVVFPLEKGFEGETFVLLSEQDIFGPRSKRPQKKRRRAEVFLQETASLSPGDLIVHSQHGIGRYEGLEALVIEMIPHDCVCLSYDGGDKLYVPVENLDVLNRYSGENAAASLDRLGSTAWQSRKARVKKRLMEIADHLIHLAAQRRLVTSMPLGWDASLYEEFAATFPFSETEDQLNAIEDTLQDLQKDTPMDRLICGDVGFGKTEVAMRAAFAVAASNKQMALIAPTTLLCRQHYGSFKKRFEPFGVHVGQLSRLVPTKEAKLVKQEISEGRIKIVIGTHGLFRGDLPFKNLELAIIDEEQHFGVKQKEKLKELYPHLHLLTLSATPIPRTLQLSLTGVRDLSLITTPPIDRLAVRTYVMPFDGVTLREALMREIFRGGQVFVVCPRIEDLTEMEKRLQVLVPDTRRITVHGQMAPSEIEEIMVAFCDHAYDIMLSTNIIESGLDLPRVNTIIIHRADHFGLSQLYQLRGRVGRSKQRGYAYMTFDPHITLTPMAKKRLEVLQSLDTLGGGFQIASHDMDIRGAGNLLGSEQSGHIKEVGSELYQQMLQEALESVKTQGIVQEKNTFVPTITLKMPVLIPVDYIYDLSVRLDLYRRLSHASDSFELLDIKAEMIDRFGPLPEETLNLMDILALKILCRRTNVERIDVGPRGAVIAFYQQTFANPQGLISLIQSSKGILTLKPDQRLGYIRLWQTQEEQKQGLKELLHSLEALINSS